MSEECANPLYAQWINEWADEARERNIKAASTYRKAYKSIKECPLLLHHPSEAQQLHGFGLTICRRLLARLKEHCEENGLPAPQLQKGRKRQRLPEPDAEEPSSSPPKRQRKAKPYVPALRSGAYAILMALSELPEGGRNTLMKRELQEAAQPYCDSSFTAPSDTTKFYTAWKSIETLEKNELVYTSGRPSKYCLSEDGWEVAKKIKASTGDLGASLATTASSTVGPTTTAQRARASGTTRQRPAASADLADDQDDEEAQVARAIRASLKDTGSRSQRPSQAEEAEHSNKGRRAQLKATALQLLTELENHPSPVLATRPVHKADLVEPHLSPVASRKYNSGASTARGSDPNVGASSPADSRLPPLEPVDLNPLPAKAAVLVMQISSTTTFQPFRVKPGTFTVELLLDNREVRSKTDRDYIQNGLVTQGVQPVVRPLDLGDAMWVAKMKDARDLFRLGEEGDEIVLDWIVERKRLDDLIGSIKDGRFHEQKFRMKRSGVRNIVYIIEEYSVSTETAQTYHESVMSAITGTQVVNEYFVKRTRKLDDTIRYLVRMTRMLKRLYEDKPLLLIPSTHITPETYPSLLASLTASGKPPHHITLFSFSSLVHKSEALTLRDIFLKMLMCTRGVSADKAMEIQKHWNTPREFVEAFEQCGERDDLRTGGTGEERKRKELVFRVAGGFVGGRKIGKALSAKMAEIWGEDDDV